MRPQNAILRASIEKEEDPAVSTGGARCGASGKDRLFPGAWRGEHACRKSRKPPGKQVALGGLLAYGALEHPEDRQLLPGDAGTREPTDTSWGRLALSSTVNRSQSSTEVQFVANQLT